MAFERTLVQIRERNFLDVLDLALVVIRERPITLGLWALVGIAPFAAFNAWLLRDPEFPAILLVYLLILEVPWATAPLTIVLGGLMFGDRPSAWHVFRTLARSFVPMLLYQFLLRGILLISFVFYPLVPTRMAFLDEVILLERGRWWKVFSRSSQLCQQRGGELFGQWLAQLFYGFLFVLGFWLGTEAMIRALFTTELTWDPRWEDVIDIRSLFAIWVAVAFFGVARFLSYIDQRIRMEGWEVELRLRSVGRAMEDAERW